MPASVTVDEVTEEDADAIAILIFEDDDRVFRENPEIETARTRAEWTGEKNTLVETFRTQDGREQRIFMLGLGQSLDFEPHFLHDVAATLGKRLDVTKDSRIFLDIVGLDTPNAQHYGRIIGESLSLLTWDAKTLPGTVTKATEKPEIILSSGDVQFDNHLRDGIELGISINFARTLSQTPPNIATPLYMAEQARQLALDTGLECRVIEGEELITERLEGLITVGKASENPPCLIRLSYTPRRATDTPPIVIIGKTITYDTGGLSLKINNGMVGMKRDKDGGCAVLGAMHAIATTIQPSFPVVGLLVAAENSVSNNSMRPDDVITYRNGVTVEITNTDAEGRLVLADALCWACDVEQAASIVDFATLTGGVVVALGSTYAGVFSNDTDLLAALNSASKESNERIWQLPLHAEYREMLKSPVADLVNSNPNRKAHPIQGAAFLEHFVTEGTPWAHIDIAGVHSVDADTGAFIKGPTGWGVRLIAAWLRQ